MCRNFLELRPHWMWVIFPIVILVEVCIMLVQKTVGMKKFTRRLLNPAHSSAYTVVKATPASPQPELQVRCYIAKTSNRGIAQCVWRCYATIRTTRDRWASTWSPLRVVTCSMRAVCRSGSGTRTSVQCAGQSCRRSRNSQTTSYNSSNLNVLSLFSCICEP